MAWLYVKRGTITSLVALSMSTGACSDSLATLDSAIEPTAPSLSRAQNPDTLRWGWDSVDPATGGANCEEGTFSQPSPECCYYMPWLYGCSPIRPCSEFVAVTLDPPSVRPRGTTTVRVDVALGQSCSVELTAIEGPYSGGHKHLGRPLGQFGASSGVTNEYGYFLTTYTASPFGGEEGITARVVEYTDVNLEATEALEVKVPGLQALPTGSNYENCCSYDVHPNSHNGTAATNDALINIASAYAAEYPGSVLKYNDMSLEWGGLFDIGPNYGVFWQAPHDEHRLGTNVDIGKSSVPSSRHAVLVQIFINNGSPNFLDEGNHWHLRF